MSSTVRAAVEALKGVEPDEIDVAVAADAERAPSARALDDAGARFHAALDTVIGPDAITDAELTKLEDESSALRNVIAKLQSVTALRFKASRGL